MDTIYIPTIASHLRRNRPYIKANKDLLQFPAQIKSVVIVGSSCTGKSTLVDALRQGRLAKIGIIDIPKRYVTRPCRQNDNTVENTFLTHQEFNQYIEQGKIDLTWDRDLGNRIEQYGFAPAKRNAELIVYSANNDLYHARHQLNQEGMLFLEVIAPYHLRVERLKIRSPDMNPLEISTRLADHPYLTTQGPMLSNPSDTFPNSSDYPQNLPSGFFDLRNEVHLRIKNYDDPQEIITNSFVYFIESLAEIQNHSLLPKNENIKYVPLLN